PCQGAPHRARNSRRGAHVVRQGADARGHLRPAAGAGDVNAERLRSIFWKEFIQMRRDRTTLGLMLGVPVMQLLLFGFAIRQEVRNLPTMVFDLSRTQESRQLAQQFEATDNFHLVGNVNSYNDAIEAVDAGRARAL